MDDLRPSATPSVQVVRGILRESPLALRRFPLEIIILYGEWVFYLHKNHPLNKITLITMSMSRKSACFYLNSANTASKDAILSPDEIESSKVLPKSMKDRLLHLNVGWQRVESRIKLNNHTK